MSETAMADGYDEPHTAELGRTQASGFTRLSRRLTAAAGSGKTFGVVVAATIGWTVVGIVARFPHWWEVGAAVGLPFVNLLMLVGIQHTQNHNDRAIQLKLDELIRASEGATNRMMTVEDASAQDLLRIHDDFRLTAEPEPEPEQDAAGRTS